MSSYKRVVVYIFLIFFIIGCANVNEKQVFSHEENLVKHNYKYKSFAHEDKYIMFALEFNRHGEKLEARELYKKLYYETYKEEYLQEFIKLSYSLKKYNDVISIFEKNKEKIIKDKSKILKIYALTLIQKSEYEKAKDIFLKIYKKSSTNSSLLNLTNIMYVYLNEKEEAINLLESHAKINGCNELICSKLLTFYQEQKNINGIISVLKRTYYSFRDKKDEVILQKVYNLLMYYLEKKDINEAISFLEESNADNEKLLRLYRNKEEYKKAYDLAKKLYEKSINIDYLAQIAIIEFEGAKDKKTVLKSVIKKFEDVLSVLDNHVYQNYLGYILIDFDIDVNRGLKFVKKALKKAPNNLAYIDSLAWGQYKLKDCKNAYINMKKVVDNAGLNDLEIKTHWDKIKECNK